MRIIRLTIATALISLGVLLFGQSNQVQFKRTVQIEKSTWMEKLTESFLRPDEGNVEREHREPTVIKTYTLKNTKVVYDENYGLEDWMTSPFESVPLEAEPVIEDWMTSPFESVPLEAEPVIEDWMTSPFESALLEAEPGIEDWMTSPF